MRVSLPQHHCTARREARPVASVVANSVRQLHVRMLNGEHHRPSPCPRNSEPSRHETEEPWGFPLVQEGSDSGTTEFPSATSLAVSPCVPHTHLAFHAACLGDIPHCEQTTRRTLGSEEVSSAGNRPKQKKTTLGNGLYREKIT